VPLNLDEVAFSVLPFTANFEISTTAVIDPDSATIKTSTAGLLASSMSGLHE
jgi:hypothetical protein